MKNTIISITLLSALFSGCGTYSKYQRPSEITTDSIFGSVWAIEDSASIADISWQEFFADKDLSLLIEKGLKNNTNLKQAELNTSQAESALKSAKLSWLPSINLVPGGNMTQFNNWHGTMISPQWSYSLSVACSWEIETFGKITNTMRTAESSAATARDYQQAVRTGLISSIANQYYTLLMLDKQQELALASLDRLGQSVKVLEAMMKTGMVTEIAVSQMRAAYYKVQASLEDIRKSISNLETSLSNTICETPHSIKRSKLSSDGFPEKLKTGYPVKILSRRPDVRAAENNLAAAYYATNVARSALYPSLTLSGVAGWTNDLGSTILNPGGLLFNVAGSVMQPVFNSRALRTNLEIAKAKQEQALLSFKQAVLDAGAEVNTALTQYQSSLDKEKSRTAEIASLEAVVSKSKVLMQNSSVTYLEVLTAETELLAAQTAESQDTFVKIQAIIDLYRALGGGQESNPM